MSGFFGWSIYLFRVFGINVRLHIFFIIFAAMWIGDHSSVLVRDYRLPQATALMLGAAVTAGFFFCIMLHEFGHSLATRWCDGDSDEILIWPLGGLAFCQPPFHPTAHLISTVAGPFVTFILWGFFSIISPLIFDLSSAARPPQFTWCLNYWLGMMQWGNGMLLLFNLIPAFPMDGGRMLRDTLWHFMGCEKATRIAVMVARVAAAGMVGYGLYTGIYSFVVLALFCIMSGEQEVMAQVGHAASGRYNWSLKDRLKRGPRRKRFKERIAERMAEALHTCHACGRTDASNPELDFRVTSDGEEYCKDHLPKAG